MSISEILLWIFMIAQMVTTFLLIKLVTDFLNRFRLQEPQQPVRLSKGSSGSTIQEEQA